MVSLSVPEPCPGVLTGASANVFLSLINTLMLTKCPISSPDYYPEDYGPQLKDNDEFDFIVVGAGSAGSVVANVLSENGKYSVLVLEAGGVPTANSEIPGLMFSCQQTEEDWQYLTKPSDKHCTGFKDHQCRWPRGKLLGGCSSINAMLYIRGNKRDYDDWAAAGNPGWDYESVLDAYKANENLLVEELKPLGAYGDSGYLPLTQYHSGHPLVYGILNGAKELGYPTVPVESPLGYFEAVQTIEAGTRANSAKAFLGPIKDRSNLKVAHRVHVHKLVIDSEKVARGVVAVIGDVRLTLKAKKEVILSAGSINSPKILLLSGVGPKKHLSTLGIKVVKDAAVGNNLQDHLILWSFYVKAKPAALSPENALDDLYQYFAYQRGALSQMRITNVIGFINTRKDSKYPNIEMHHIVFPVNDPYLLPEVLRSTGIADDIAKQYIDYNKEAVTFILGPTLLNPKSRGTIRLKSTDPDDKPIIETNQFENEEDIQILLEGIRYGEDLKETQPMKDLEAELLDLKVEACKGFEFGSDDYWKCSIRNLASTLYHPVGTCKMGPSTDAEAVVDSRLRVRGVQHLRVIDLSIVPKITSGNTNGPAMMIGRKGAELVLEDWESEDREEL